jgi:hypothetical protein
LASRETPANNVPAPLRGGAAPLPERRFPRRVVGRALVDVFHILFHNKHQTIRSFSPTPRNGIMKKFPIIRQKKK